jgi:NADP-dependent 3-hydroxy acid dehydrogenase YdfG
MSHQGAAKFAAALAPNVARKLALCRRRVLATRAGESCAASSRSEKGSERGRGPNYSKRPSDARLAVTGASSRIGAVAGRDLAARGARSRSAHRRGDFGRVAEIDGMLRATTIMPSAVGAESKTRTSDAASRKFVDDFYQQAIPPESIARSIHYAIEQPADADVNQIVIRPTVQEF